MSLTVEQLFESLDRKIKNILYACKKYDAFAFNFSGV